MKRRNVLIGGAAGALVLAGVAAGVAGLWSEPAAAQSGNATGEVTKVDKAGGKVEIKHGEIKALDMPPMRMSWRVREPRLLEGLAVGDKVRFTGEKIDGQFVVTAISKAP